MNTDEAIRSGVAFGVKEETARAVVQAYQKAAKQLGREFNPTTWSNTVWEAEAQRFERAHGVEAHYSLILHLQRLRVDWEEQYQRGSRGWHAGTVGERLTKR